MGLVALHVFPQTFRPKKDKPCYQNGRCPKNGPLINTKSRVRRQRAAAQQQSGHYPYAGGVAPQRPYSAPRDANMAQTARSVSGSTLSAAGPDRAAKAGAKRAPTRDAECHPVHESVRMASPPMPCAKHRHGSHARSRGRGHTARAGAAEAAAAASLRNSVRLSPLPKPSPAAARVVQI